MNSKVDKAFETIVGYCDKNRTCRSCRYYNGDYCILRDYPPADWPIKLAAMNKDRAGE